MKIAAAYIRVSTDDQTELSPDSQVKQIQAYAKAHGYSVPEKFIFVDEGISGKNTKKRVEFNRMIALAKTKPKPFDAILLWKFSRFARNREDSIVYKSMLRKQLGIEVVSITENLGDDKMSILIEALIEAMDEYYSINLAEEVKRGMKEKVSRGAPVSVPSFGYVMQDGAYVINEEQAAVVRMIFNDYCAGMGLREIAVKLNTMGVQTVRGNLFENRTVEYILHNPVYIGKIRWNPERITDRNYADDDLIIVEGKHPPIIEKAVWDEAQAILERNKLIYGKHTRKKTHPKFMLQGLVRCSACGGTLCRAAGSSVQCHKYAHGICHESHSITIRKLNDAVIELLELSLANKTFTIVSKSNPDHKVQTDLIERQIAAEQRKLIRIKEAYADGIDSLEEYKVNKERILSAIEKLKQSKSSLPSPDKAKDSKSFEKRLRSVPDVIKDKAASDKEKNELLRGIIDHIAFDRKNMSLKIVYYI